MEQACIECHATPQHGYFNLDIGIICIRCFTNNSQPTIARRVFVKLVCVIHKCSTYNSRLMGSHEMPWCDIVSIQTSGIQKPKTQYDEKIGGCNGNINRHYYRDWEIYSQQKDKMINAEKKWKTFRDTHGRKLRRKKYAYTN